MARLRSTSSGEYYSPPCPDFVDHDESRPRPQDEPSMNNSFVSSMGDSFVGGVEDRILLDREVTSSPVKALASMLIDTSLMQTECSDTLEAPSGGLLDRPKKKRHREEQPPLPPWIRRVTIASLVMFCLAASLTAVALLIDTKNDDNSQNGGATPADPLSSSTDFLVPNPSPSPTASPIFSASDNHPTAAPSFRPTRSPAT